MFEIGFSDGPVHRGLPVEGDTLLFYSLLLEVEVVHALQCTLEKLVGTLIIVNLVSRCPQEPQMKGQP